MKQLQLPAVRVLVVEDSTTDAKIVQQYLRSGERPARTRVVSRLSAALALIAEETFDVVLLDLTLPDAEGLDAVRRMHEALPGVPIVILSASENEDVATQAVKLGAQDYLIKGQVDDASLRRALRYAIERQQENLLLRRLADAAGRVFSTLDVRAMVDLLAAEARRLWGGSVALYARGAKPDEFLLDAFDAHRPLISPDGTRLALPLPGTSGRNEWVLDIRSAHGAFGDNDIFALELLRGYTGTAIQNLALFSELEAQRASVIRLNALKDDLIAVLAHDFKGPLTSILGFTELLESDGLEGEDATNALRTIRGAATRLAGLANDTLALSRIEQGDLNIAADPVNIADLVRESVDEHATERSITLDIDADDPIVRGDPARLRQVFDNLIGNAIKYSPGGDGVSVKIKQSERALHVAVADSGIGIPEGEMKLLFERFRRASNAKMSKIKGTGLGLYLAKTLVERHGGTIHVQSALNEGSTFSVVLPRMRDGVGGMLRVVLLAGDERLAPYVGYELRSNGQALRHDKTITGLLERLEIEPADIVLVDTQSIDADLFVLFHRVAESKLPIGLIGIGTSADNAALPWHARLPKPFLAQDLQAAIGIADRARLQRTKWK
ncbi:MAG TPA: hybrid sensor histidine kinase/response regulator, partial [Candidatus Baltobacteraceae bacterium]|nr:hybrid sensor histidine kinase/response regulator [Candidatus Baltobacteraceae bacterium]